MSSFTFDSYNDLVNFLFESKHPSDLYNAVFDEWEVMYLSMGASLGAELNLNTKGIDVNGDNEYMQWKKVKNVVKSYLTQDMSQEFSNTPWHDRLTLQLNDLDIRLRCPKTLKNTFDEGLEFDSFRLSFLINSGLTILNATSIEKALPVSTDPIKLWETYIDEILRKWKLDNDK